MSWFPDCADSAEVTLGAWIDKTSATRRDRRPPLAWQAQQHVIGIVVRQRDRFSADQ